MSLRKGGTLMCEKGLDVSDAMRPNAKMLRPTLRRANAQASKTAHCSNYPSSTHSINDIVPRTKSPIGIP